MRRTLPLLVLVAACGRPTFTKEHAGTTVTVTKGDRFRVDPGADDLTGPHIAGDAVKALAERYEFEAVRKGGATIVFARVDASRRSITGMPARSTVFTLHVEVE